jgi:hypothetical protein
MINRTFAVTGLQPVSLSSGRVVTPGERFEHTEVDEHDLRLIETGQITQIDGPAVDELADLKREELDEIAVALGIENPDTTFKNKADAIAAIKAAQTAAVGAGDEREGV